MPADIKIGSIININEDNVDSVRALKEKVTDAEAAYDLACQKFRKYSDDLWDFIHDINPELKDYVLCLNKESTKIVIVGKK